MDCGRSIENRIGFSRGKKRFFGRAVLIGRQRDNDVQGCLGVKLIMIFGEL